MTSSRARSLALAAGILLLPTLASAQGRRYGGRGPYDGPADQGIVLSGRIGFGFPGGDIIRPEFFPPPLISWSMDDHIDSKIPIWLEIGYRFTPIVWGTVYLELAPVDLRSTYCLDGSDCDGSDVRFGLDVQFHMMPYQRVDPWFGLGIGAEFLTIREVPGTDERFSGWEFPLLEGGLDFAVTPRFTLGPYASLSFGRYNSYRASGGGTSTTTDIGGAERTHNWFQIGVKGTIKL